MAVAPHVFPDGSGYVVDGSIQNVVESSRLTQKQGVAQPGVGKSANSQIKLGQPIEMFRSSGLLAFFNSHPVDTGTVIGLDEV